MRQHDPDETVRYEVVMAIISAAKKDFNSVTDDLLNFVKERTLDKKVYFNIFSNPLFVDFFNVLKLHAIVVYNRCYNRKIIF